MAAVKTYTDRVRAVRCPKCGALKGAPCQLLRGGDRVSHHRDRLELAGEAGPPKKKRRLAHPIAHARQE